MKNKMNVVLANVLFWVALRVSRCSSWLYVLAYRFWQKTPECIGRWIAEPKVPVAGLVEEEAVKPKSRR